jgi:hypothetical protein
VGVCLQSDSLYAGQVTSSAQVIRVSDTEGSPIQRVVPYLKLDSGGTLHLFWHRESLLSDDADTAGAIHHLVLQDKWNELPNLPGAGRAKALQLGVGTNKSILLMWCSEMVYGPGYHAGEIFLQTLGPDGWTKPLVVSDKKAKPSCMYRDDLAIVADSSGEHVVLWTDWRNSRALDQLLSGEGEVARVYFASEKNGSVSDGTSLQGRGKFDAYSPSSGLVNEKVYVMWVESSGIGKRGGRSDIMLSEYDGRKWSKPLIVDRSADVKGLPARISTLYTASTGEGGIDIVYVTDRSGQEGGVLVYKRYVNDQLSAETILGLHVFDVRFGHGRDGWKAVVFQKPSRIHNEEGLTLLGCVTQELTKCSGTVISEKSVGRKFDVAVDREGTTHIVYALSDAMSSLSYMTMSPTP